MRRLGLAGAFAVSAWMVFGCSGADPQDVLSNTVGTSATTSSSGTSGDTTSSSSGTTGSSSSSSGDTGTSGTTTSSSSSGDTGGCVAEQGDSDQNDPIAFTTCVSGTLQLANDRQDYATFEMPKNNGVSVTFSGPVTLTFYDASGRGYAIDQIPNKEGQYAIEIDLDPRKAGVGGAAIPWSINLAYK